MEKKGSKWWLQRAGEAPLADPVWDAHPAMRALPPPSLAQLRSMRELLVDLKRIRADRAGGAVW